MLNARGAFASLVDGCDAGALLGAALLGIGLTGTCPVFTEDLYHRSSICNSSLCPSTDLPRAERELEFDYHLSIKIWSQSPPTLIDHSGRIIFSHLYELYKL